MLTPVVPGRGCRSRNGGGRGVSGTSRSGSEGRTCRLLRNLCGKSCASALPQGLPRPCTLGLGHPAPRPLANRPPVGFAPAPCRAGPARLEPCSPRPQRRGFRSPAPSIGVFPLERNRRSVAPGFQMLHRSNRRNCKRGFQDSASPQSHNCKSPNPDCCNAVIPKVQTRNQKLLRCNKPEIATPRSA